MESTRISVTIIFGLKKKFISVVFLSMNKRNEILNGCISVVFVEKKNIFLLPFSIRTTFLFNSSLFNWVSETLKEEENLRYF